MGSSQRWSLPFLPELGAMHRRVAFDHGCAFFDTLAFQGGLGASLRWLAHDPPYMRDDHQHLTLDPHAGRRYAYPALWCQ